jgi:hypothetical protein
MDIDILDINQSDNWPVAKKKQFEHLQVLTVRIVQKGVDITSNLGADWFTIHMTYGMFGVGARAHYHQVCQFAKDYDYNTCDDKFNEAIEKTKFKSLFKFIRILKYHEIETTFADEQIDGAEDLYFLPETVDRDFVLEHGFYAHVDGVKSGYYFRQGERQFTAYSNFVVNPLMHVYSKTDNKRVIEINNGIKRSLVDLPSKSLISLEQFTACCYEEGNFMFWGNKMHLMKILQSINNKFTVCWELKTLGWQPEGFFAWSNAVFIPGENKIEKFNQLGIATIDGSSYFSPSASDIYKDVRTDDDEYENDRYLKWIAPKTPVDFSRWAELMKSVYGDDGMLGIAYVFIGLFKDLVYKIDNNCPLLFAYGEKGSGKSKFAESVSAVFLHNLQPFNLNHGTDFAFFNRLSRFRNCVTWFDEFDDQAIKEDRFQSIKGAYDGSGRERGKGTNKNKTEIARINSALLLTGQYLSTRDDNAALTRCLILAFTPNDNRTADQIKNYDQLKATEKNGLTSILTEVLQLRPMMQDNYAKTFPETFNELRKAITDDGKPYKERVLRNYTAVLNCWKLISRHVQLPFTYAHVFDRCRQDVARLSRTIAESDSLADFWNTVEFLLETGQIQEKFHFRVQVLNQIEVHDQQGGKHQHTFQQPTRILFIRLTTIHKLYMEAFRKQHGKNGIDRSSLNLYISSSAAYLGDKKGYKFTDETGKEFNTSCDVFLVDKLSITLERDAPADSEPVLAKITGTLDGQIKLVDYLNKPHASFTIREDCSYKTEAGHLVEKIRFVKTYADQREREKLTTGAELTVEGKLYERKWTDNHGQERVKHTLEAVSIKLINQQLSVGTQVWKAPDLPFD